jgi:hypothetical protein
MGRDNEKSGSSKKPPREPMPRFAEVRNQPPEDRSSKQSGKGDNGPGLRRAFDNPERAPTLRDNEAPLSERKSPPPPRKNP